MKKVFGFPLLGLSLFFLIWRIKFDFTGNFINNYFSSGFMIIHILGILFLVGALGILVEGKGLEGVVVPTGPSYRADHQRALGGVKKYDENRSSLVIITGEMNNSKSERSFIGSQPMRIYKEMRKSGVPRDHFVFESLSHNTQENVLYILEKLKEKKINEITVITDKPHAKRFEMMFNKSKKQGIAPENLEVKTYSENINNSYGLVKASLAYLKDYLTFDKEIKKYKEKSK